MRSEKVTEIILTSNMNNLNSLRVFFVLLITLAASVLLVTARANEAEHDHAQHDQAQGATVEFQEGTHYHRISPAVPTNVEMGSVEVLELFWYGCPHCYQFEKYLTSWKQDKAANIEFVRIPAVLNQRWIPHARAYYALETMGEHERIHPIFFAAIHEQGRRLRDMDSMARFLTQHGIDEGEFKKAYDSLYVEIKTKRAKQLVRQYGSSSVPAVIINGKYRSTASDAGGFERLLQLIDQLAQQEADLSATFETTE